MGADGTVGTTEEPTSPGAAPESSSPGGTTPDSPPGTPSRRGTPKPDTTTPDPGLFGPGSMTWRIHGDPGALMGGLRALLLQALEPESMAAFERVSDFRDDPWGRLFRTAEFVGATSFGTTAEAAAAGDRVRMVHHRLGVDQPHLLSFIHLAFVDSMLDVHRRAGPGISDAEADQYVSEQVRAAQLVGVPADLTPTSAAELAAALEAWRPRLRADTLARDGARLILVPPMSAKVRWLTPAQGLWASLGATSFALLPRWARKLYGGPLGGIALAGLPGVAERQATLAAKSLRAGLRAIPENNRRGPHMSAAAERLGLAWEDLFTNAG